MTTELDFITIARAAQLINKRAVSPVELTSAMLRRIEALDPQINAFITVTADLALEQARRAEAEICAGQYRGLMHGIPFALKDNFNTAGILTSAHSKLGIGNIPKQDAAVVEKMYRAGAVLLGKLASYEFAHGGAATDLPWPPARNPWNPVHMTSGSSSGPGAAVASGFVSGAWGTDTGGSIRSPASLCGVVGLKPTYGLVSRRGVIPSSFSMDACGPMARTVEDCAIMLQAAAGYDPLDSASMNKAVPDYRAALSSDIRGLRIGVLEYSWRDELTAQDEVLTAMANAIGVLRDLGAKLETTRMRPLQDYYDVSKTILLVEHMAIHRRDLIERPGDFCADWRGTTLAACVLQALDYVEAQRERTRMLKEVKPLYEKYDVLLTAGSPAAASRFDSYRTLSYWQRPSLTAAFSIIGGPALVLCNGYTKSGLPLGMQLAGRPFDDATVLRVAHAYETATSWHLRRPALVQGTRSTPVTIDSGFSDALNVDARTLALIRMLAARAGLTLPEPYFAELCHTAPYALAMGERVRRGRMHFDEPANVFRFPG